MERARLGGIEISVVSSERMTREAESTDKPVERGQDVSDHTKKKPIILDITGVIVGEGAAEKLNKLDKFQKEGTLIQFIHRTSLSNAFIEKIVSVHEAKNRNGYEINMKLKQIRVVSAQEMEINVISPKSLTKSAKTDTQVKSKANAGVQQPQEKVVTTPVRELNIEERIKRDVTPGGTMKALMELYKLTPQRPVRDPNIMMD